jgi:plasmid replication initiation protein
MNNVAAHKSKKIISQSNELTEAAYYLGLKAKRVLWICLSQIGKKDNHDGVFTVLVSDYQSLFEVGISTATNDVRDGLKELGRSTVIFHPKEGEYSELERPWLSEIATKSGRGKYRVEFNYKLVPYIVGLTQQFTTFNLQDCGRLNSVKTIRLYESLCQYRSSGVWAVSVDWLTTRYQLPISQRDNFAELKRSFLEPSIKRINKETPLSVSYIENTKNNKVASIVFNIVDEKLLEESH